jgi:hypothetical protein
MGVEVLDSWIFESEAQKYEWMGVTNAWRSFFWPKSGLSFQKSGGKRYLPNPCL